MNEWKKEKTNISAESSDEIEGNGDREEVQYGEGQTREEQGEDIQARSVSIGSLIGNQAFVREGRDERDERDC